MKKLLVHAKKLGNVCLLYFATISPLWTLIHIIAHWFYFTTVIYLVKQINKFCHILLFPLKVIGKGNVISASISNSIQNVKKKHSIVVERTIEFYWNKYAYIWQLNKCSRQYFSEYLNLAMNTMWQLFAYHNVPK